MVNDADITISTVTSKEDKKGRVFRKAKVLLLLE